MAKIKKSDDIPGNGFTLAKIAQRLEDHCGVQVGQFGAVDDRLERIEGEVKTLILDKGSNLSNAIKVALPILVSLSIVGGGWIWGLARQEAKIAELDAGRHENRGAIKILSEQFQEMELKDERRDGRYEAILQELQSIQKKLDRMEREKRR